METLNIDEFIKDFDVLSDIRISPEKELLSITHNGQIRTILADYKKKRALIVDNHSSFFKEVKLTGDTKKALKNLSREEDDNFF